MASNTAIFDFITVAIGNGNLEAVQKLVGSYNKKYSPAFCRVIIKHCQVALICKQVKIAKFLLQNYANATRSNENWLYVAPLVIACEMDSIEIVNFLLRLEPQQQFVAPEILYFALLVSSKKGSEEIVAALLSAAANPNEVVSVDEEKFRHYEIINSSPLILACQKGYVRVVDILLKYGAEVNCFRRTDKYRPLHIATEIGHVEIVGRLLKHNARVYVEANDNVTPLHLAPKTGALKLVEMLLCDGANIDARTSTDSTPLLFVAKYKHNEVAKMLLDKGACVDARDGKDKSALYYAVEKRNLVLFKYVMKHNPVINDKTRQAVRRIVLYDHADSVIVKNLAEHGFTFSSEDLNDSDLFTAAVKNEYAKIVEWFLSNGLNLNDPQFDLPLVHWAVENGHKEVVEALVKSGCAVNCKNEMSRMLFSNFGVGRDLCAEIAQLVMCNEADVQKASRLLFEAIDMKHVKLCKILIETGADINCRNEQHETPLHVTLSKSHLFYSRQTNEAGVDSSHSKGGEIIKLLLRNNANFNARTRAGYAAIHLAAMHRIEEALLILLDHGADVNIVDSKGNTTLHLIISRKFEQSWDIKNKVEFESAEKQMLELLLHNGADVNRKTANGLTPLHLAARRQSSHIPHLLLRHGADVNSRTDEDDSTPLHFACQEGNQEMVELLLSNKANVEACQQNGMRPLHSAALFGHRDAVDALLEFDAEVDAQEGLNETALHCAVINNHLAVVKSLLNNGCDITIVNNCGLTAFEIAVSKYAKDYQSFIEECDFGFIRNTDKLLSCFTAHIIRLDVAGLYVCDNILRYLNLDSKLVNSRQMFEEEISRMKHELLLDQYTLHGVFVKRRHPVHMRNELLRNALDLFDFSAYPIYEPLLRRTVKKSGERIKLLDAGSKSLNILLKTSNVLNPQQLPTLSAEISVEIVSYLGKEDLKNLISCVEHLKRQLTQWQ